MNLFVNHLTFYFHHFLVADATAHVEGTIQT